MFEVRGLRAPTSASLLRASLRPCQVVDGADAVDLSEEQVGFQSSYKCLDAVGFQSGHQNGARWSEGDLGWGYIIMLVRFGGASIRFGRTSRRCTRTPSWVPRGIPVPLPPNRIMHERHVLKLGNYLKDLDHQPASLSEQVEEKRDEHETWCKREVLVPKMIMHTHSHFQNSLSSVGSLCWLFSTFYPPVVS